MSMIQAADCGIGIEGKVRLSLVPARPLASLLTHAAGGWGEADPRPAGAAPRGQVEGRHVLLGPGRLPGPRAVRGCAWAASQIPANLSQPHTHGPRSDVQVSRPVGSCGLPPVLT